MWACWKMRIHKCTPYFGQCSTDLSLINMSAWTVSDFIYSSLLKYTVKKSMGLNICKLTNGWQDYKICTGPFHRSWILRRQCLKFLLPIMYYFLFFLWKYLPHGTFASAKYNAIKLQSEVFPPLSPESHLPPSIPFPV